MMSAGVPGSIRNRVFRRDNYQCRRCGLLGWRVRHRSGGYGHHTQKDSVYLSIDHVVPRSRGGSNEMSNLQVLCTMCNVRKGTRIIAYELNEVTS